jgi:hypothetical protein
MSITLIGRKEEQAILIEALHSNRAEMVAVFGRPTNSYKIFAINSKNLAIALYP